MFVACGIWCLADVSSVSPSSEQTAVSSSEFDKEKEIQDISIFVNLLKINMPHCVECEKLVSIHSDRRILCNYNLNIPHTNYK